MYKQMGFSLNIFIYDLRSNLIYPYRRAYCMKNDKNIFGKK